MSGRAFTALVLYSGGFALVTIHTNWLCAIGLFCLLWAHNLEEHV